MTAAGRAFVAAAAIGTALSGCGSPSQSVSSATPTATRGPRATQTAAPAASRVGGVSVSGLEHALLTRGGPPPSSAASCRGATAAERNAAPFGATRRPLFSCALTVLGEPARYDVQILRNGCYVAERARPGQAVYGCGVRLRKG
jgi:hypothetical protein